MTNKEKIEKLEDLVLKLTKKVSKLEDRLISLEIDKTKANDTYYTSGGYHMPRRR